MKDEKKEIKDGEVEETKTNIKPVVDGTPSAVQTWRQIVIETDGNSIRINKAEVAGNIELVGILQSLIVHLNSKASGN